MDVKFLLLSLFMLVSCMPQSGQVAKSNLASTGTTTPTTTTTTPTVPTTATRWNFLSTTTLSITINSSNLNTAYVVGSETENYLGTLNTSGVLTNFTAVDYCMVANFSLGGNIYQLRSRVVPIAYYDFTAKRVVRVFRVDFDDTTTASSLCSGTLKIQNSAGNYVTDTTVTQPQVYEPAQVCSNCTSTLSATSVRIFKKGATALEQVPVTALKTQYLQLSVNPNGTGTGSTSTCSTSYCTSRGYDCCLENQCVKDGGMRPSANTIYASLYPIAEQERIVNPLAYLNYPQIYYVCGTTVPPVNSGGSSGTGTSTGGVDYPTVFAQLKKDLTCMKALKAQSSLTPFHQELLTKTWTASTDCKTNVADASDPQYFQTVMSRIYKTCGCSKTSLSDMITYCPAYEYQSVLVDSAGEPTRIECYTPPLVIDVPNVQQISLSGRTAPHRFFETTQGLEKDILGSQRQDASGNDFIQEGDSFTYLDSAGILPSQSDFSMNAILGQMTVGLTNALPAKTVNVELDKLYVISTTSGYYTPCPTCAKDSWISSLSAFPSSSMGVGLQAMGHSTTRDQLSTNYTGGNYEDTIFGRACWLPPTMIPFSHAGKTNVATQRTDRLQTQAAYFVNGYQRDWFGFNKGAVIGSFNGVNWFAIGKGRIVKSTSKKLFIAINAPFADVAAPSIHAVQIQAYDGIATAAAVDYDPQYSLQHAWQNEAGNCQANHMCNTDGDCITKLGWEYACADVAQLSTSWPKFDADANELAATSENLFFHQILQQKKFPSSATKRCVYRGAGAPCINNLSAVGGSPVDYNKRKLMACAQNFYCARVNTSEFNAQIARWAAVLDDIPVSNNHRYGRDTNILGRPLNYISTTGTALPAVVQSNMVSGLSAFESTAATSLGICRPAKLLPSLSGGVTINFDPYNQHAAKDTATDKRTDYISQIGSCDSAFYNVDRYNGCPALDSDNNLYWLTSSFNAVNYKNLARNQNACGLDAITSGTVNDSSSTADLLAARSPFTALESVQLSRTTILEPTFARDACMRRAGSVCNDDYDCYPNRKHSEQVDYEADYTKFGNSAEMDFYREYLVCGQADPKPTPSTSSTYTKYDITKNRCCREIGKDLTTHTANVAADSNMTPSYINANLDTGYLPGVPAAGSINPTRYTRFAHVKDLGTSNYPVLNASITRTGSTPSASTNINTPYQWKTIRLGNSSTCCGGGYIRKFSDGTNDWTQRNRLTFDVKNFRCLNSKNTLLTDHSFDETYRHFSYGDGNDSTNLYSLDHKNFCLDYTGASGGCAVTQIPYSSKYPPAAEADAEAQPYDIGEVTVDTLNPVYVNASGNPDFQYNSDLLFMPRSADSDPSVIVDYGNTSASARRNIALILPSFIPRTFDSDYARIPNDQITNLVQMVDSKDRKYNCAKEGLLAAGTPLLNPTVWDDPGGGTDNWIQDNRCDAVGTKAGAACCFHYDPSTRILRVILDNSKRDNDASAAGIAAGDDKLKYGVRFKFRPVGTEITHPAWTNSVAANSGVNCHIAPYSSCNNGNPGRGEMERTTPATSSFYLDHLGRLELSGIPQIGFPALRCNDNSDRLVPGIFKHQTSYSAFANQSRAWQNTNRANRWETHYTNLTNSAVFSPNDFKCCAQLGKKVTDVTTCCSGAGKAVSGAAGQYTCALPAGTNLNVYFNRFVSNEGMEPDYVGGFVDADFDTHSGEPLISKASVVDKLINLGATYCTTGKTRGGAAFGAFDTEPASPVGATAKVYQIVDSSADSATLSGSETVGYWPFMSGFRWNHHIYCND